MRRLLAAGLLGALLTVFAVPSEAAPCAGRTFLDEGPSGVWATYQPPAFSVGPEATVAHAGDADKWYVTNGLAIARSQDGGCTWKELLVLPETPTAELPASRATDRIRGLAAAGGGVAATVEVLSELRPLDLVLPPEMRPESGPVSTTLVLWGENQLAPTAPLTVPLGAPGPLAIAPSAGQTVYVTAGGRLHRTTNGGTAWALATPPPDGGDGVVEVAVHPKMPAEVYAVQSGGLHRSTDGGAVWTQVVNTGGALLPAVAVTTDENQPRQVRVVEQLDADSSPHQLRISDDGTNYRERATGAAGLGDVRGPVQSGIGGARLDQLVFTTEGTDAEVYSYDVGLDALVAVDDFDLGPLLDVDLSGSSFLFRTPTSLARWIPGATLSTGRRSIQVGPIGAALPPLSPETVLSGPTALSLGRDESATVDLDLALSPEPTPIDVFFLLDTSGSMDDVVNGLANGFAQLARDLGAQRIDAQFGLGEYQDTAGTRYERRLDLRPPGEPLRKALAGIRTAGGAEPAWTALHQMSTGTGIPEPRDGDPVPRGQGATWRQGSLRVVVHATDEIPSNDADGATKDQAVRALLDDGVRHVGIEVVRDRRPDPNAIARDPVSLIEQGNLNAVLRSVSRATGALAPAGGVDCDDDGTDDLAAGEPLVCQAAPSGAEGEATVELAKPLTAILSTLRDEQAVGVDVSPPAAAAALRAVLRSTSATPTVDVKKAAALGYALTVTCTPAAYGKTYDLALKPRVGARTGVPLPLRVQCEPLPPGPEAPAVLAPPQGPQVRPAVAVPAPPPIPPPAPANAPAPAQAPAPAALPAGVTAVNPVVGLGLTPEEQEAELALAEQAGRQLDELAMVAVDQRPDTAALRLLPLVAMTAAAAVVARRRREQAGRSQQV